VRYARFSSVDAVVTALKPSYPIYCVHPKKLRSSARRFLTHWPGRVLYALKCNPSTMVLGALYEAGIRHFDTASLPEIAQVWEMFDDAEAYFLHPVKARSVIGSAYRIYEVRHFVVDHIDEVAKIIDETGGEGVQMSVRLATPAGHAALDLSTKFGAPPEDAVRLLQEVARRGCLAGLSFHVGSQCRAPDAYRTALELSGEVLAQAGVPIASLSVGGGFPAPYLNEVAPPLETFIEVISEAYGALGLDSSTVLMCEPGRAMVADGVSLVAQVQLRKDDRLYINDGRFGSLSEVHFARVDLPTRLIRPGGAPSSSSHVPFTIYGPTCDGEDVLPLPFTLPEDVREGDWIEIGLMGAYTSAMRSSFNGFYPDTFVVIDDPEQY